MRNLKMADKFLSPVDFHAHILPGADHGSGSVNETLFQLDSAMKHGVCRIIATPHFYPHRHSVDAFIERRNNGYRALLPALNHNMPKIALAAEVLICDGMENMPGLDKLFIQGTNTLLLELPTNNFSYRYTDSVEQMIKMGIDVIIAHADRYSQSNVNELLGVGARLQLNASSVARLFVKKHITDWISCGKVVALGSDIHGRDNKAYRTFSRAAEKLSSKCESIKTESDKIWQDAEPFIFEDSF